MRRVLVDFGGQEWYGDLHGFFPTRMYYTSQVVALIEKADGTVHEIPVSCMRFVVPTHTIVVKTTP